jgi:hypothetical protein
MTFLEECSRQSEKSVLFGTSNLNGLQNWIRQDIVCDTGECNIQTSSITAQVTSLSPTVSTKLK